MFFSFSFYSFFRIPSSSTFLDLYLFNYSDSNYIWSSFNSLSTVFLIYACSSFSSFRNDPFNPILSFIDESKTLESPTNPSFMSCFSARDLSCYSAYFKNRIQIIKYELVYSPLSPSHLPFIDLWVYCLQISFCRIHHTDVPIVSLLSLHSHSKLDHPVYSKTAATTLGVVLWVLLSQCRSTSYLSQDPFQENARIPEHLCNMQKEKKIFNKWFSTAPLIRLVIIIN